MPRRRPIGGHWSGIAYLWDPWFLVWGLLLVAALQTLPSRRHPGAKGTAGRMSD